MGSACWAPNFISWRMFVLLSNRSEAVAARWCQAFHIPCGKLLDSGQLHLNPSHFSHFLGQKEPLLWLPGGPVFGILWALVPQCIHGFGTQRASISAVRTPCFYGELGVHDDGDPLNEEERGQWKGEYKISTQKIGWIGKCLPIFYFNGGVRRWGG